MKPRITLITLAVDDLHKALAFYRDGLGLATPGIVGEEIENGAVVFIELQAGLRLALWPRKSLSHDTGLALSQRGRSSADFSLAHNVNSPREVDEVMAQAQRAGATIVKPGHATAWGGYIGYFQDPDAHLWEVAWNPQWVIED